MLDKSELDEELIKEVVSVGGGYGQKIERCIACLERLSTAIDYLEKRLIRSGKVPKWSMKVVLSLRRRYSEVLEEAYKHRKNLIIYREAIGLIKHREVFEVYNLERFKLSRSPGQGSS